MNYRNKIIIKNCGFTLIELLLLIAILAVLASLLLGTYQQRTTNLKIEKTAIQMQQLLQAAGAFWSDKGIWPNTNTPGFNDYIPINNINNPWGNPYAYLAIPTGPKFRVYSGILPSQQIVNRLVTLLPNAAQDPNNPNQVVAFITIPEQLPQNYLVQQIGATDVICDKDLGPFQYCRQGKTFYFSCPNNWVPQVLMSTEWMTPDDSDPNLAEGTNPISNLGPLGVNNGENPKDYCVATTTPNYYQCNIRATAESKMWRGFGHPPINLGLVTYAYIAYCIPKSQTAELQ